MPTLPASDIDRAVAFYRDTLGLTPTEDEAGGVRFEAGGSWFLVYPSQYAGTNKATAAGWEVDDLDGAVAELKGKGVTFQEFEMEGMKMENSILTAPDGMRAAWFEDTEGNIIGLSQLAG
jgi:catechol 2,3-dioxygenase-like lactoylglutathione lyase family enzyme